MTPNVPKYLHTTSNGLSQSPLHTSPKWIPSRLLNDRQGPSHVPLQTNLNMSSIHSNSRIIMGPPTCPSHYSWWVLPTALLTTPDGPFHLPFTRLQMSPYTHPFTLLLMGPPTCPSHYSWWALPPAFQTSPNEPQTNTLTRLLMNIMDFNLLDRWKATKSN